MIVRLAEILLGAVFLISGGLKAWAPAQFYGTIEGYQMLPAVIAFGMAYYLPYLEIVAGLGLVAGVKTLECAYVVSGLVGIFLVALVSAWVRGLDIECGCFGPTGAAAGLWEPVARDVALGFAALYVVYVRSCKRRGLPGKKRTPGEDRGSEAGKGSEG